MKKGDRIYFKELYITNSNHFKPGDIYEIVSFERGNLHDGEKWINVIGIIKNLNNNEDFFLTDEMREKLITQQEYRDNKINEILK